MNNSESKYDRDIKSTQDMELLYADSGGKKKILENSLALSLNWNSLVVQFI